MFVKKRYIKYLNNKSNILLDAPHAQKPRKEIHTDEIVEKVAVNNGFNAIISLISRTQADLNRSINYNLPLQKQARTEYIEVVEQLYKSSNKNEPYLHLTIHGMKDIHGYDIEIGTTFDKVCDRDIREKFTELLQKNFLEEGLNPIIKVNHKFSGHPSLGELKMASNYNIIQIEISKRLRTKFKNEVINVFSETLKNMI